MAQPIQDGFANQYQLWTLMAAKREWSPICDSINEAAAESQSQSCTASKPVQFRALPSSHGSACHSVFSLFPSLFFSLPFTFLLPGCFYCFPLCSLKFIFSRRVFGRDEHFFEDALSVCRKSFILIIYFYGFYGDFWKREYFITKFSISLLILDILLFVTLTAERDAGK